MKRRAQPTATLIRGRSGQMPVIFALENMHRSHVSGGLPNDQIRFLLDEVARLQRERADGVRILQELEPARGESRRALNRFHKLLFPDGPTRR